MPEEGLRRRLLEGADPHGPSQERRQRWKMGCITRKQPASGARRDQESPWDEGSCLRTQESRAKEK